MQPSALFCRTQEAQQRALAVGATLDNVRAKANIAAAAWAKEGEFAQRRETRLERVRIEATVNPDLQTHERGFSENPDRGFSEAEDED